jgi:hypothetical protein
VLESRRRWFRRVSNRICQMRFRPDRRVRVAFPWRGVKSVLERPVRRL